MNSKGITPVVATVLLIGISIGATTTAYKFILGAQEEVQDSYEDRRERERLEDSTAIDIESVYNSSVGGWAILQIRNTGTRSMTIKDSGKKYWNVFVDGEPVGNSQGTGWKYVDTAQDKLGSNEVISINTTRSFPESSPVSYKTAARYGAEDTNRCAPSEGSPC